MAALLTGRLQWLLYLLQTCSYTDNFKSGILYIMLKFSTSPLCPFFVSSVLAFFFSLLPFFFLFLFFLHLAIAGLPEILNLRKVRHHNAEAVCEHQQI